LTFASRSRIDRSPRAHAVASNPARHGRPQGRRLLVDLLSMNARSRLLGSLGRPGDGVDEALQAHPVDVGHTAVRAVYRDVAVGQEDTFLVYATNAEASRGEEALALAEATINGTLNRAPTRRSGSSWCITTARTHLPGGGAPTAPRRPDRPCRRPRRDARRPPYLFPTRECAAAASSSRSARKFSTMPLWTT